MGATFLHFMIKPNSPSPRTGQVLFACILSLGHRIATPFANLQKVLRLCAPLVSYSQFLRRPLPAEIHLNDNKVKLSICFKIDIFRYIDWRDYLIIVDDVLFAKLKW